MKKLLGAPILGLAALLIGCDSNNTEQSTQSTEASTNSAVSEAASGATFEKAARFTSCSCQGESQEKVTVGEGAFRDPSLSGYAPDPTVARAGDDDYMVPSAVTHRTALPP